MIRKNFLKRKIKLIQSYRDTFLALADLKVYSKDFAEKIAGSAGLRNAIVHEYVDLNLNLLYSSIKDALKHYVSYLIGSLGSELAEPDSSPLCALALCARMKLPA